LLNFLLFFSISNKMLTGENQNLSFHVFILLPTLLPLGLCRLRRPHHSQPLSYAPCTHQDHHASCSIADRIIFHSISQTVISKPLFRSGECKDATRHVEFHMSTMSQRRKHMDIYGQCQGSICFCPTYIATHALCSVGLVV